MHVAILHVPRQVEVHAADAGCLAGQVVALQQRVSNLQAMLADVAAGTPKSTADWQQAELGRIAAEHALSAQQLELESAQRRWEDERDAMLDRIEA